MATAPRINVYASLPQNVVLGAGHSLRRTNWRWVHCLSLSLEELNTLRLSQRPYKWIRYATGVVVGAEGFLSTSCDSHDVVDYEAASLLAESADLYYHTSEGERQRVFPVDPHILRTQITSSVPTTRREAFRDEVAERDGGRCVLTEADAVDCDAVHLLAHSKDDKYISTHTQHRSRDTNGGDIIKDIDSVRNGLFLNKIAHERLGKDLAFLVTPNFAMNTADIDLDAEPAERRCTAHFFLPSTPFLAATVPSGSPLRIFYTPEYPPAILFDILYAGAVLHHFGTSTAKDGIATAWNNIYPTGVMTVSQAAITAIADARAATTERIQAQAQEREARRMARQRARQGPDTIDMIAFLPYFLVPPDELQAAMREVREQAEAEEQRRVEEKVEEWIKQVNAG